MSIMKDFDWIRNNLENYVYKDINTLIKDLKEVTLRRYNLNDYQFEKILDKAYEHYDTYNDLIDKVEEIADFIVEITNGKYCLN